METPKEYKHPVIVAQCDEKRQEQDLNLRLHEAN
jgi:hypothetical protein